MANSNFTFEEQPKLNGTSRPGHSNHAKHQDNLNLEYPQEANLTINELQIADEAVFAKKGVHLSDIQRIVLRGAWQNQTYEEIADREGYSDKYLKRDVGPRLWKLLSDALGEKVSKKNFRTALERKLLATSAASRKRTLANTEHDWNEADDVSSFCGRTSELVELERWIVDDNCRMLLLLGFGGIGKTALSIKLAQQVQGKFERVIWRSLRHAPKANDLVAELINSLSNPQDINLPETLGAKLSLLLNYLQNLCCLLILDGVEAVLSSSESAGYYQEGYQDYAQLFDCIGQVWHQSCLVLTSREKPRGLAVGEGKGSPVKSLRLTGLPEAEGTQLLKAVGISGSEDEYKTLIELYTGNPLLLKIVAVTIKQVFAGKISEFLEQKIIIVDEIKDFLDQQFERLTKVEKNVVFWLAIEREPVALQILQEDVIPKIQPLELAGALESLRRRSLVEVERGFYTLQSIIMEYATEQFVKQVCEEIAQGNLSLFKSHCLIKARAKDFVRETQIQYILKPVIDRLLTVFGSQKNLKRHLYLTLMTLREQLSLINNSYNSNSLGISSSTTLSQELPLQIGYAGGNVLNLLCQLQTNLEGYDFSNLNIWQAYLQGFELRRVNFSHSDFKNSVFTRSFGEILSIAFSRDGEFLTVANTSGEIHSWEITTTKKVLLRRVDGCYIQAAALSSNGQTLASSSRNTISLYDNTTGQCLKTLRGHLSQIRIIAFSLDDRTLASSGNDGVIKLWSVSTGQGLADLLEPVSEIKSIVFSPSCQILASGSGDGTIKLWSVNTGQCLKTLRGASEVRSVIFSPDGQILASGSSDGTIKLWSVNTGQCLKTLRGASEVRSVIFSPDGQILASGSGDGTIKLWSVNTGQCLRTLQGHNSGVQLVIFSLDGKILASSSNDSSLKLWSVNTGSCLKTLQGYSHRVRSLSFGSDSQILASGSLNRKVELWDISTEQRLKDFGEHLSGVQVVAFSPNSQTLASCSCDKTIKLWSINTGQCLKTFYGHLDCVSTVVFSPNGRLLASGSNDQSVRVWEISTGECLQILQEHTASVRAVVFSLDSQILTSVSNDGSVKLWDLATRKSFKTLQVDYREAQTLALSRDGQILVTGNDNGTIKFWDIKTGQCSASFQGHASPISAFGFSQDDQILISGSDCGEIKLWDIVTNHCLHSLPGHTDLILAVALAPDDQILASSSQDETIKLWNLKTGQCTKTLTLEKPYKDMNIADITGLTDAQKSTLKALGAVAY